MIRVHERGLTFDIQKQSTDELVVNEVVKRQVYLKRGMTVNMGDVWLDLGANIGTFSILAASQGATVIAYEPHPDNVDQMRHNMQLNGVDIELHQAAVSAHDNGTMELYIANKEYNKYRHTLRPTKGRDVLPVSVVDFHGVLARHKPTALKMDIEGAEIPILDECSFEGIAKLTFEYHFNVAPVISEFYKRMERLSEWFPTIRYARLPDRERYNLPSPSRIVQAFA